MKKNCDRFVEDIAAFASDSAELSPAAAAHVQHCVSCREKIAEFKAVAAMHREVASNIAEPKRRLDRRQLEESLAIGRQARRDFEIRWRPILAGAAALALFVGGALIYRTPPERLDARQQSTPGQPERKLREEAFEQSLLALRHDVEGGRERMLSKNSGAALRHYRLKDAESELR
jgi:hypothetical protein